MKEHFTRFLGADPDRLHAAAHSHHPWPDVTLDAQEQAWLDAAMLMGGKWDEVFGELLPEARGHIAARLSLPDPDTIAVAPNTHDLVRRILSCLRHPVSDAPWRVLATDGEFHSFERQLTRLEEDGLAEVERVTAEPFASLSDRLSGAAAAGGHDLVFVSHVLFDSGAVVDVDAVVSSVPADTFVVIDGYHGFMAVPTDLSALADRVFYLAGGYKYAMAGEGACFCHCPPGWGPRPRDTGWFAGFGQLEQGVGELVGYPTDGGRFLGSTFDPSGWYRFNAVQRWLDDVGWDVARIHAHVRRLQGRLLDRLDALDLPGISSASLVPGVDSPDRGNFLTFRTPDAGDWDERAREAGVVTDHRGDRWRIGLGVYHDADDVDRLAERLAATRPSATRP